MAAVTNDYSSGELVDSFGSWFESTPLPLLARYNTLLYFGSVQGKTIVDYGCGSGHFLRTCVREGAALCLGVDYSIPMIEEAKKLDIASNIEQNRIQYFAASCLAPLSIKPNGVDLATAHYMLHHCATKEEMATFYQNVYNDLKPGGKMFTVQGPYMAENELDQKLNMSVFGASLELLRGDGQPSDPIRARTSAYRVNGGFDATADVTAITTSKPLFTLDDYLWSPESIMSVMKAENFAHVKAVPIEVPSNADPAIGTALSRLHSKLILIGGEKPV